MTMVETLRKKVKWTRTPTHILRMHCLLNLLESLSPSKFLEIGSGTGDFTQLFLERKYEGVCYDLGPENREILKNNLSEYANSLVIVDSLSDVEGNAFDLLLAFEVLEHIQDDAQALTLWSKYLSGGGRLVLSVPAHSKKYSREDERVGHIRRYEKSELIDLVKAAGFEDVVVRCYGFPLSNFLRILSRYFMHQGNGVDSHLSYEERSIKSGIERAEVANRYSVLFNSITLLPFIWLQKIFFPFDLGDGYLLIARKKL